MIFPEATSRSESGDPSCSPEASSLLLPGIYSYLLVTARFPGLMIIVWSDSFLVVQTGLHPDDTFDYDDLKPIPFTRLFLYILLRCLANLLLCNTGRRMCSLHRAWKVLPRNGPSWLPYGTLNFFGVTKTCVFLLFLQLMVLNFRTLGY